jgi:hypothetical protein
MLPPRSDAALPVLPILVSFAEPPGSPSPLRPHRALPFFAPPYLFL